MAWYQMEISVANPAGDPTYQGFLENSIIKGFVIKPRGATDWAAFSPDLFRVNKDGRLESYTYNKYGLTEAEAKAYIESGPS